MTAIKVAVSDSTYQRLSKLATRQRKPVSRIASRALEEAVAAWMDRSYLQQRAARSDDRKFRAALAKVADIEPDEVDRIK